MTSNRESELSRHRLFHAMVLMGGSLALRCGGETSTSGPTGGTSSSTGGSISSGGATGGAPGATGGIPSTTGGNASGGGITLPGTGGAPVTPECPPTQWSCAAEPTKCYGNGYHIPNGCKCDPTRPADAAACGVGQSLVCREGRYDAASQPLKEPIGFECACVANQLACGLACDAIFPNSGSCSQEDTDTGLRKILCNCAVIVLR